MGNEPKFDNMDYKDSAAFSVQQKCCKLELSTDFLAWLEETPNVTEEIKQ